LYWPLGAASFALLNQINYFIAPLVLCAAPLYFVLAVGLRWLKRGGWRPWGAVGLLLLLMLPIVQQQLIRCGTSIIELYMTHPLIDNQVASNSFLEWVEYLRRVRMHEAHTPFLQSIQLTSGGQLFQFLPIGMTNVLTAPLPWAVRTLSEGIGSLEMVLWYPLLIGTVWGMFLSLRRGRIEKLLLCMVLLLAVAMALLEGNVGTLFRHRAALWPLLFIFTGIGFTNLLNPQMSDK